MPDARTAVAPPQPYRGRLVVLGAVALTALNLRTAVTGFTAVAGQAQETLGFGPTVIGLIGTIVTACFAISAFTAPLIVRRYGLDRAALMAVAVTTAGLALRAWSGSTAVLLASTIVAFAGIGASNAVTIPVIREHFGDRLKVVSTAYLVLLQVGQFLAPIIAVALASAMGWRLASALWPVCTATAAVFWLIAVVRKRPPHANANSIVASPVFPEIPETRPVRWRSAQALGLIGLMGMTALHTYSLITWLPSMLTDAGLSSITSASMLSVFAGMGLIGAFAIPPLATRLKNPFPIVVVCAALMMTGYLGLALDPQSGAAVWSVLLGLGVSTFPLCLTLIATRSRSTAEAASLSGAVQGVGYAIGCVGPILLGLLHEATGSWSFAYWLLIGTLALTLGAGWFACRPNAGSTAAATAEMVAVGEV